MCWYKEIADKRNKDFAFHEQTKDKLCVDIVGGEDVTHGRLNDNLLTGFVWSRTHLTKEGSSTHRQATEGRSFTTIHAVTLSFPVHNPTNYAEKAGSIRRP